jgi:putative inorganic carbon (hco3(-)) transporter
MMDMRTPTTERTALALSIIGTIAYAAIGVAVALGFAESLVIGVALVLGAIVVAAAAPAAGISAVLLAVPTMYDLHPMPRGDFSLLELGVLTATVGITARLFFEATKEGWGSLGDVLMQPQLVVPVALLLLATVIALVTVADPAYRSESLREVRTVIVEPLMFLAVARMAMRDRLTRHFAGAMLLVGGSVVAAYAIFQIALDLGGVQAGAVTRATATYTHPNNLALFLERTVLVTIGIGVMRPRWWPVWVLAGVQLAGLGLTFSRGALIAVGVGVSVLFLLRGLYTWLLLLLAGGVGVAGVGIILFPERLVDAGGSGAEPTRFTIWRASWRMILDHPLFGVGPDQFLYQYSRRYIEPMGWPERYTSHPHNIVLDTWLRLGVVGLAAAATLVAGTLWWLKRWYGSIRDDLWAMGALAALTGGLAHGLVDNGFFLPDLAVLTWFFVALIFTVPKRHEYPLPSVADADRSPMEATWPVGTGDTGTAASAHGWKVAEVARVVAIVGMVLAFILLPFVSEHPYLPFVLIGLAGLVTIIDPAWGLAGVLATIPVQDASMLPFVRGELTFTQVALFGFVLGWAVTLSRHRIRVDSVVVGFLLVFAAYSISLVETDDMALWFGEMYRWAAAFAAFVVARSVLTSWSAVQAALYGTIAGVIGTGVHTLVQLVQRFSGDAPITLGNYRALGTFGTPNPLAAYIEFTVPVLLAVGLMGFSRDIRDRVGRAFWLLSLLASGLGLLTLGLTQSRGGYIGIVAALLVVFLILPRRIQLVTLVAGSAVVIAFLLTPVGQSQVERFRDAWQSDDLPVRPVHGGGLGRESLWVAGIRMIDDKPMTGIGAGEYDYHYRQYVPEWVDRHPQGQAHNGWLHMGAQSGLPGIMAFTAWVVASLAALWGAARRATDEIGRLLAWGAFAVFLAFTVHGLVDYLNVLSLGIQLSAVTAMGLALSPEPLRSIKSSRQDDQLPQSAGAGMVRAS